MTVDLFCIVLVCLGCLFPALLIDAIKASPDDPEYPNLRYKVCACFGAILFFLVLILK